MVKIEKLDAQHILPDSLVGMSVEEVTQLLGKLPQTNYLKDYNYIVYWLGPESGLCVDSILMSIYGQNLTRLQESLGQHRKVNFLRNSKFIKELNRSERFCAPLIFQNQKRACPIMMTSLKIILKTLLPSGKKLEGEKLLN